MGAAPGAPSGASILAGFRAMHCAAGAGGRRAARLARPLGQAVPWCASPCATTRWGDNDDCHECQRSHIRFATASTTLVAAA